MKRSFFFLGIAACAIASPAPALAQEIVMRRPLPVPTKGADWRVSPFVIYDGSGNVVQPQNACGPYEQKRTVECVQRGEVVGDYYCREAGPKPSDTLNEFLDAGCSYTWYQGGWQDPGPSCSNAEPQEQVVECRRDFDQQKVSDALCGGSKPSTTRTVVDHSTCTYSWNDADPFHDPGNNCTATETWTKNVFCERDLDKEQVDASLCDASTKPAETDVRADYSSCTYSWDQDPEFLDPGPNCTATETQTKAVWCRRDLDQNVEPDAKCDPGQRPPSSQVVEDFSGCSYSAVQWTDWSFASTCSTNTSRTRTAKCQRSDGTIVSNSECTGRGIALTEVENAVQNLSTCGYDAVNWTNPANPTCSAANTETQTADCRRTDGTIVADSECTGRGVALTRTVNNAADYSGCGYSAINWTNPANPTCSAANTETQTADCRRSDGTIVADSFCASNGVSLTRTVNNSADYSGCSYSAVNWTGWSYASTCSTSTSRTRTADCRRSDGTIVSDSNCTTRGIAISETQTGQTNTSSCGYAWEYGAWQDPGASCTSNEIQTRSEICRRSDGASVSTSLCSSSPNRQSTNRTVEDYSGCNPGQNLTVNWGAWSAWSSMCSSNASRTRSGTCMASGAVVDASVCTSRGLAVTQTEQSAQYSACPVNGSCGSANGSTTTTKPTSNLCSAGSVSTVSGSGPWSWTCSGSNGGSTASCSAQKTASCNMNSFGTSQCTGSRIRGILDPSWAYDSTAILNWCKAQGASCCQQEICLSCPGSSIEIVAYTGGIQTPSYNGYVAACMVQ